MFSIIRERLRQGMRTIAYPAGACPRFPTVSLACPSSMTRSARTAAAPASRRARPTRSRTMTAGLPLDMGRCLFCNDCVRACPQNGAIQFSQDYRLATRSREDLIVRSREQRKLVQPLGRENAPALRPLVETQAGQRRR